MQYEQTPFRRRNEVLNAMARSERRNEVVGQPFWLTLHNRPDAGERWGSLLCALGGVAITLSLIGAVWTTSW